MSGARWVALYLWLLVVTGLGPGARPALGATPAPQDSPVVRGVLFFSPTCPHCEDVIQRVLPSIFTTHGGQPRVLVDRGAAASDRYAYLVTNGRFEILLLDASMEAGGRLYQAATAALAIPADRGGVPRLVLGDSVLVGSYEIQAHLAGLIERHASAGGLDWPSLPGIAAVVAALPISAPVTEPGVGIEAEPRPESESTPRPAEERTGPLRETGPVAVPERAGAVAAPAAAMPSVPTGRPSVLATFARDPTGNGLALLVLIALGASLVAAPLARRTRRSHGVPGWLFFAIGVAGLAVATYLAFVEVTGAGAVCGPVGDCRTVHASRFARVAGIPVSVLGVLAYLTVLAIWLAVRRTAPGVAGTALFGVAYAATAFSAYLTALEPFVIGATCLWCVASAAAMGALLWLAALPGEARRRLPEESHATS
jgi:uncharacterized membrane protein